MVEKSTQMWKQTVMENENDRNMETCVEASPAKHVRVGEVLARMITVGVMRTWLDSGCMFEGIINTFC